MDQKVKKNECGDSKDQIVQYIRRGIRDGELTPGTKLPSERKLAEMFSLSRAAVREALKIVETYGIIKTLPQSGSVIVGGDVSALDGLLVDVIQLDAFDFASMIEMRVLMEVHSVRLCAQRRTEEDIIAIREALDNYIGAYKTGDLDARTSADFAFHRSIVTGSKNTVLRSMLMLLTPNIMKIYRAEQICLDDTHETFVEHNLLFQHILMQDIEAADATMRKHLLGVFNYANSLRNSL